MSCMRSAGSILFAVMLATTILTFLLLGWHKRVSQSLEIIRYREEYYKNFYLKKVHESINNRPVGPTV